MDLTREFGQKVEVIFAGNPALQQIHPPQSTLRLAMQGACCYGGRVVCGVCFSLIFKIAADVEGTWPAIGQLAQPEISIYEFDRFAAAARQVFHDANGGIFHRQIFKIELAGFTGFWLGFFGRLLSAVR